MQFRSPSLAAALLIALGLVGCVGLPRAIVPCPLTYSEQEKELLTVVPKGIRREEALKRLASAGVEGSFGISHRVYYCDLWNRPNGERWHINVALLFDDVGKLYKTQMAESDVTTVPTTVQEQESHSGSAQSQAPSAGAPAASAVRTPANPLN